MTKELSPASVEADYREELEPVGYDFGLKRRTFVQWLGAGLMIAVSAPALAQRAGRGGGNRPRNIAARIHLGKDGGITVFTGKVEGGQGARAELTLAAAEELRVPPGRLQLVMADTALVPDDGTTAGSRSTPSTVPAVRQGAAAAREVLRTHACKTWSVDPKSVEVREGKACLAGNSKTLSYAELAADEAAARALDQAIPQDVSLTPVKEWKVLGHPLARPNGRDLVTGAHQYPSDIARPGMLYGRVLRAPAYGAKLISIDLAPARALKEVVAVQDQGFVGVAAPSSWQAGQALEAISATAKWEPAPPHPTSGEVFSHLKEHAQGIPANPFAEEIARAKTVLKQEYHVAYVQHAPLEPRAAVAEWTGNKLAVWAGTQNPFGYRSELARAFHLPEADVRVIVPDFGAGFGGKHTGEAAIEAARLAKGAGRPVSLRWTREEEFIWAYFRPAALILAEAGLNAEGRLTSWHFVNVNSGNASLESPYHIAQNRSRYVSSAPPLRQGSYRSLAAAANNFARESFMDELAVAAGADPLAFRLNHLENPRLRAVLEAAAKRFDWARRVKETNYGVGLACGTDKGSVVAACVEIEVDRATQAIRVRQVCEAFECGAILNPANLLSQIQGAIIMGLGPALREEMIFEKGQMANASFRKYRVPRLDDVPALDIELLDRPDLPSAGAGETPIIAVAPAIANAVFHATGKRIRQMPIRLGA